ncbi:hypothetical protein MJO29_012889 [Puccinia striiformis f. sp. tritici]|nr:hypothetical protein MJO29_012889 [Puccinia striiformis f. sp. tritici]
MIPFNIVSQSNEEEFESSNEDSLDGELPEDLLDAQDFGPLRTRSGRNSKRVKFEEDSKDDDDDNNKDNNDVSNQDGNNTSDKDNNEIGDKDNNEISDKYNNEVVDKDDDSDVDDICDYRRNVLDVSNFRSFFP